MSELSRGMSLFEIEAELAQLMDFRDNEELTPEERAACDKQVAEYVTREIAKVDGLRWILRECEERVKTYDAEAKRQTAQRDSWKNRLEYLKGCCLDAMNVLGKKKLEGRTGYIMAKGNGGLEPLELSDLRLIPDELCRYVGWISVEAYAAIPEQIRGRQDFQLDRDPRQGLIREALKLSCVQCGGSGQYPDDPEGAPTRDCPGCDGTGKTKVPGARLLERGSHLEVK